MSSHVNYFLLRINFNISLQNFIGNKFQNTNRRRRRNRRRTLLVFAHFYFTISFRIASKHIERAKTKYETMGNSTDLHDRSVLEKLLRIDKQTAQVMALDMLMAGVDTVNMRF